MQLPMCILALLSFAFAPNASGTAVELEYRIEAPESAGGDAGGRRRCRRGAASPRCV